MIKALLNLSSLEPENIRSHGKDFLETIQKLQKDMKDFLDDMFDSLALKVLSNLDCKSRYFYFRFSLTNIYKKY